MLVIKIQRLAIGKLEKQLNEQEINKLRAPDSPTVMLA
jgi:hypothetical protein